MKLINSGTFGSVYEFIDSYHPKSLHVAIKIILPHYKDIGVEEIAYMRMLQYNNEKYLL